MHLRTFADQRRLEQAQPRIAEVLGIFIGGGQIAGQHLHVFGALEALADGRSGGERIAIGQRGDDLRLLEHGVELAGLLGHGLADVLHGAVARLLEVLRHRIFAPLRVAAPAEPRCQQQQHAPNTGPLVRMPDAAWLRSLALLI